MNSTSTKPTAEASGDLASGAGHASTEEGADDAGIFLYCVDFLSDGRRADTFVGAAAAAMLGAQPPFPEWEERLHQDDRTPAVPWFGRQLPQQQTQDRVVRYRHPQKGWRHLHVIATCESRSDGGCRLHGVTRDITAHQETQKRRQLSQIAIDSAVVPVYWFGSDGAILEANPAGLAFLQLQPSELTGRNIAEFLQLRSAPTALFEALAALTPGDSLPFAGHFLLPHGGVRDAEGSLYRICVESEDHYCCVARDVTAQTLQAQRAYRYEAVFESSDNALVLLDAQGCVLDVNPAYLRICGQSRAECLGQHFAQTRRDLGDVEQWNVGWLAVQKEGFWRGEVWIQPPQGQSLACLITMRRVPESNGAPCHVIARSTDITELKLYQRRLERLAHYDPVTQLPNRSLFAERLKAALEVLPDGNQSAATTDRVGAVAYLDLDGFQAINDRFGQVAGDCVLTEIGSRLQARMRPGDLVARFGGDEFAVLLTGIRSLDDGEKLLKRLLRDIATPVPLRATTATLSGSIGATFFPQDNSDADTLVRHANQAMYAAKQAGRNRYHVFDAVVERETQMRQLILSDFERALKTEELKLHLEPRVNLRTGEVLGAEALLRWQHPVHGLIGPSQFLHYVENTELIAELGDWAIRFACEKLQAWAERGIDMCISVNIAALHLMQQTFAQRLSEILQQYPAMRRDRLELEVVETGALVDLESVTEIMRACCKTGVRFALDDFGTGYSSLTYLRQLPAQTVKIDRSFLSGILNDSNDRALIVGILALARSFGLDVVAEGVETEAHGDALLRLGCPQGQGYGIARPMPAECFEAWVSDWRARWQERQVH